MRMCYELTLASGRKSTSRSAASVPRLASFTSHVPRFEPSTEEARGKRWLRWPSSHTLLIPAQRDGDYHPDCTGDETETQRNQDLPRVNTANRETLGPDLNCGDASTLGKPQLSVSLPLFYPPFCLAHVEPIKVSPGQSSLPRFDTLHLPVGPLCLTRPLPSRPARRPPVPPSLPAFQTA